MGLEAATHISELVPTNPDGADAISQGDDHIRLVKLALRNQFPAFVGDTATPKAVTLTEDEISDAALLSRIAGNRFVGPIFIEDPSAYWSHDGTADRHIGSASAGVVALASNVAETTINANEFITGRMQGSDHCRMTTSVNGGFQMQDLARLGFLKAGYRNPRRFAINANTSVLQNWEGQNVALNTGSLTITFDSLGAGTKFLIICATGSNFFVDGAGAGIQRFDGVARTDGDFTAPFGGVYECWQPTDQIWYIWQVATVI